MTHDLALSRPFVNGESVTRQSSSLHVSPTRESPRPLAKSEKLPKCRPTSHRELRFIFC